MQVLSRRFFDNFFRQREQNKLSQINNTKKKIHTRRGGGGTRKCKNLLFKIVGNNCAGLKGKKESFENLLKTFSPAIVMIQETK